ncbi:MAG: hypothetical protein HY854_12455 [Burkholderiales bacterium]|nr:hypothetical protein [Burkholderiales bacterium]
MKVAAISLVVAVLACVQGAQAATDCNALLARRKMTLVVPFKPGGGYDAYARLVAPVLQERTGARVTVSNVAGANGFTGVKAVAASAADSLVLGVFDLRDLLPARLYDPTVPAPGEFVPLGSFGQSVGVWAARRDTGDLLASPQPLTMAVSTGVLPRALLPAMLLGRELKLVRGYGGTAERWLALLRGEVDVTDGSNDTILRNVASAPSTRGLLVLASQPHPDFPGTPYLAGPGGVIDQRTRNLDAKARQERMELAEAAAELATSARTIVVPRKAPLALQHCLDEAVTGALFSAALREAAARQKLPLEPMRGAQVRAHLARIEDVTNRHMAVLKRLAATQ